MLTYFGGIEELESVSRAVEQIILASMWRTGRVIICEQKPHVNENTDKVILVGGWWEKH